MNSSFQGFALVFGSLVQHRDVDRLPAFGAFFNPELDLLAFVETAKAVALNGGEMDKDIIAAFAGNEAEAFIAIEPLDRPAAS